MRFARLDNCSGQRFAGLAHQRIWIHRSSPAGLLYLLVYKAWIECHQTQNLLIHV